MFHTPMASLFILRFYPLVMCCCDSPALDDLPPFLRQMVDSLNRYSEWCEQMLAASYPLKISSKINDNLQRQREVLDKEMKFLQEQIQLYRVSS